MISAAEDRRYTTLSASEVPTAVGEDAVLCLPIGACEQHGPHLPLDTDTTIAERFTGLMVSRYGMSHDLWALPALPYGLSLEHAWSPGTVSLSIASFTALLDDVVHAYLRATSARRILIINGHGGNRGILKPVRRSLATAMPWPWGSSIQSHCLRCGSTVRCRTSTQGLWKPHSCSLSTPAGFTSTTWPATIALSPTGSGEGSSIGA